MKRIKKVFFQKTAWELQFCTYCEYKGNFWLNEKSLYSFLNFKAKHIKPVFNPF